MVNPRSPTSGENSSQLDWTFTDPAAVVVGANPLATIDCALHPAWHMEAACRGLGPALFHSAKPTDKATAFTICGTCPVLDECRTDALADPRLDHGVRGGMDVAARKLARKRAESTL